MRHRLGTNGSKRKHGGRGGGHRNNHLWNKTLELEKEDGHIASNHLHRLIRIEEERKQASQKCGGSYKLLLL